MTPELAQAAMSLLARLGRRDPTRDQVLPEEYSTYLQVMQALRDAGQPKEAPKDA
jgi:hypothetical protein